MCLQQETLISEVLLFCEIYTAEELKVKCWKTKENWQENCCKFKASECNQTCIKKNKKDCKKKWENYKSD